MDDDSLRREREFFFTAALAALGDPDVNDFKRPWSAIDDYYKYRTLFYGSDPESELDAKRQFIIENMSYTDYASWCAQRGYKMKGWVVTHDIDENKI